MSLSTSSMKNDAFSTVMVNQGLYSLLTQSHFLVLHSVDFRNHVIMNCYTNHCLCI